MRRSLLVVGLIAASVAQDAFAEPSKDDRALAEEIFAEASAQMDRSEFAAACPKLEEVVALQPQGIGARLKLADCYVGLKLLVTARLNYQVGATLATQANQHERAAGAREKAQALVPRLSMLTITVPDEIAELDGLLISLDGAAIPAAQFNQPFAVDGGRHLVMATAPGRRGFKEWAELAFEADSSEVTVKFSGTSEASPVAPPSESLGATGSWWSPLRIGGFFAAGAGLVLSGVGPLLLATAPRPTCIGRTCSVEAQTVVGGTLLGVGGAGVVAGIVMIAVAPRAAPTSVVVVPWALPRSGGVVVAGTY